MAITDQSTVTGRNRPRFCPECGNPAGEGRFCSGCGRPFDAEEDVATSSMPVIDAPAGRADPGQTASFPPVDSGYGSAAAAASPPTMPGAAPPMGPPPPAYPAMPYTPPPEHSSAGRIALIAGAAAVGLLAIVAAVIVIATSGGSSDSAAYHQKVNAALSPVVSANSALTTNLQALSGSDSSAAQNAASQAQSAVTTARGAVGALTVPSSDQTLSTQVQQALTQETAYLQAVSAVLSRPSSENVSQLGSLSASTQSAFVPLQTIMPGIGSSLGGNAELASWANGRISAAQHHSNGGSKKSGTPTSAPSAPTTPSAPSGPALTPTGTGTSEDLSVSRYCGSGVTAGTHTTCPFALNVHSAYLSSPGNTVVVHSSATGTDITMTCGPNGSGTECTGGNNASVTW